MERFDWKMEKRVLRPDHSDRPEQLPRQLAEGTKSGAKTTAAGMVGFALSDRPRRFLPSQDRAPGRSLPPSRPAAAACPDLAPGQLAPLLRRPEPMVMSAKELALKKLSFFTPLARTFTMLPAESAGSPVRLCRVGA
jgi:hypothetical protein